MKGPLTLVSAPAGYGKSTFVGHELERSGCSTAWISLDPGDGDLRTFLRYLVVALTDVLPDVFKELSPYLAARDLPPLDALVHACGNDLERVKQLFVLALDDYHVIDAQSPVHDFLGALLAHPAPHLHLVIMARRHPPLPLARFRAQGTLVEFGIKELAFQSAETPVLLRGLVSWPLDDALTGRIHVATEGWPVALRMAGMALTRMGRDSERFRTDFEGDTLELQEYLLTEILGGLSPITSACLSQSSVLDRFCAPLCRALCESHCASSDCMHHHHDVARSYEASGLLCIDLDARGEWHRFHHLLQKALQDRLLREKGTEYVAELHRRASAWFEEQGLIEDAVPHAVKAGGDGDVAGIIARHRQTLMNTGQWGRLRHWLDLIPQAIVLGDPRLLIVQGWFHVGYPEMFETLDRVEELIGHGSDGSAASQQLRGELLSLQALLPYVVADGAETVRMSDEALSLLGDDQLAQRGFSELLLILGKQMNGDSAAARAHMARALADSSTRRTVYRGRVLIAACLLCWIDADLTGMQDYARECRSLGKEEGFPEVLAHGHCFLGICAYARNELTTAVEHLESVVLDPAIANSHNWVHSLYALALTYRALGREDEAWHLVDRALPHALGHGNATMAQQSQAFRAELALRLGHLSEAVRWADDYRETSHRTMYRFYEPAFTLVRVRLAQGDASALKRAARLCDELYSFTTRSHNRLFTLKTRILQARVWLQQGKRDQALSAVSEAVELATPGKAMRQFVDDGPELVPLLSQLQLDGEGLHFVGELLAAMRVTQHPSPGGSAAPPTGNGTPPKMATQSLIEPLSTRELEILPLLAGRLTNKEIGERLFISPVTVKRHTSNIYGKLGVHGRRDAVAKAEGLGLLAP